MYLGIEGGHDIHQKHTKEELKKNYLRRLRLVLSTEVQRIKFKQLDHLQYQYLDTILELLTGARNNCKNWIGK